MRTIARFMDARNTAEGKFLSVLLSVLLVFSFLNVTMFTDYANADGEDATPESQQLLGEAEEQPTVTADDPKDENPQGEVNETEGKQKPIVSTDDVFVSEDTTDEISDAIDKKENETAPNSEVPKADNSGNGDQATNNVESANSSEKQDEEKPSSKKAVRA